MVLIKRITAGVTAFALAAVMQGASLTAFSEGDVSAVDSITKAAIVTEVQQGRCCTSITRTKGCLWHR